MKDTNSNQRQSIMLTVKEYEAAALKKLSKSTGDYYKSGANDEVTLKDNCDAFRNYLLRPRFMSNDVTKRNLTCNILNTNVTFPIGVAPTAMQKMAHPDGEIATARACQSMGNIMILSTISTSSIEEVANAAPSLCKWFQLYIYKDRNITKNLVERAENAGFKGLVLTVDTPFFGTRLADNRNGFCLPSHLDLANFRQVNLQMTPSEGSKSALNSYANSLFDATLTWKNVQELTKMTKLPVIVKGILRGDDALLAYKHGASAVIVSNHGARQLDHVPATIDVLKEIVSALEGRIPVFIDGGFRCGADILKALALGAQGVFVGRPVIYGLACEVCEYC